MKVDRGKCQNEISYEKCRNNEVYDGIWREGWAVEKDGK